VIAPVILLKIEFTKISKLFVSHISVFKGFD